MANNIRKSVVRAWLPLAVIDIAGEVLGSTRLQKLVFLGSVETHIGEFYSFTTCRHGPYSSELASSMQNYQAFDFVTEVETQLSKPYDVRHDYILTDKGTEQVRELEQHPEIKEMRKKLEKAIDELMDVPLDDLLQYTYEKYLPVELQLDDRIREAKQSGKRMLRNWNQNESDFYPVSWEIQAALEWTIGTLDLIELLSDDLEKQVFIESVSDLLRSARDLHNVLEQYGFEHRTDSMNRVQSSVLSEFREIFQFIQSYLSEREVVKPLSALKMSDITSEEEMEEVRAGLRRLL
ncbi:MAG: hypothetical protein GF309_01760 [Candidatus Lokiarchaeota archaeon]|nr:hypothetical protein [Candidatus Lokiarchaeota archaeon]